MADAENPSLEDVANPRRRLAPVPPGWLGYCLILGLYLTLRGYHSLDGDQAYRLPLLLHRSDPALYAGDPFVRAFDAFNPHRGSLMVMGGAAGLLGLSAGLLVLFVLMFLGTCVGVRSLAETTGAAAESRRTARVGWVAVGLILLGRAGNIGTNHLFDAMVLDRLLALALAWMALANVVGRPRCGAWQVPILLCVATVIHPSVGLQFALMVIGSWIAWALLGQWTEVGRRLALGGMIGAGLSVLPGLCLNVAPGCSLTDGLPPGSFWTLAVELQSPQHMLPHLWRMPQWLAWAAYLALALQSLGRWNPARVRLVVVLGVALLGLAAGYAAIEWLHQPRITVFQPFRLATLARGICLVLVSGRLVALWDRGDWLARVRVVLIVVALAGDWMLVVVTLAETATNLAQALRLPRRGVLMAFGGATLWGLYFLSLHDTESGHWPILGVLIGCTGVRLAGMKLDLRRHLNWAAMAAWVIPLLALGANMVPAKHPLAAHRLVRGLVARCRFAAVPVDDIERLAVWCREHTPPAARFIGPPGPKTFRLWSRRSLAFNRAASPYHAAGLADWFARFQDHVADHDAPELFVRRYLSGRHSLEARYDELSVEEKAELARRQGAGYVIALASDLYRSGRTNAAPRSGPLILLHQEGRYAAYLVSAEVLPRLGQRDPSAVQRQR